jgi:hypothetical protein
MLLIFSTLAIAATWGLRASAGESSRLSYLRGTGSEECPDERALRLAVAVRLGYDPFVAWAKTTVHAQVARDGAKLRAHVYLAGEDGRARGSRQLVGAIGDCDKLIAAMSLAISIAIDPMSASPAKSQRAPAPSEDEQTPDASEDVATTGSSAARDERQPLAGTPEKDMTRPPAGARILPSLSSLRWYAGLGPVVTTGTGPNIAAGAAAFVRLDFGIASMGLEGRYDLPAAADALRGNGTVRSNLLLVSIEPCLRFRSLAFCGLVSVGSLRGSGSGVSVPLEQSTLYAAAGGRAGWEVPIIDALSLRLHAALVGNLTRVTLAIDGEDVWRAPPVAAITGLDAVARLW